METAHKYRYNHLNRGDTTLRIKYQTLCGIPIPMGSMPLRARLSSVHVENYLNKSENIVNLDIKCDTCKQLLLFEIIANSI